MTSIFKHKGLWITAGVAMFIAIIISLFPDPIDTDLTNVGNGKKSVVFVYDINRVVSNQQTLEINKAKEVIGSSANFLVARTGYPETDEFMRRYRAEIAELLFFDENGQLFERKFALIDANTLTGLLNNT